MNCGGGGDLEKIALCASGNPHAFLQPVICETEKRTESRNHDMLTHTVYVIVIVTVNLEYENCGMEFCTLFDSFCEQNTILVFYLGFVLVVVKTIS